MEDDIYLYHGTLDILLNEILAHGLRSSSYWGSRRVAEYYAEDERGKGHAPILIRKARSAFEEGGLEVDTNSVAEPLTYTLKAEEEDLYDEFLASNGSWQASLEIYESVIYRRAMTVRAEDIIYLEGAKRESKKPVFHKVLEVARNGEPKVVELDGGWRLTRRGLIAPQGGHLIGVERWGGVSSSYEDWQRQGLSYAQIEAADTYLEVVGRGIGETDLDVS